jgi:hypothetical protein
MTPQEASFFERECPSVPFCYPDEEIIQEVDRNRDIRALESWTKLILSARANRVTHMRASIGLALVRNDLKVSSLAAFFRVSPQRVNKLVREIRGEMKVSGSHL